MKKIIFKLEGNNDDELILSLQTQILNYTQKKAPEPTTKDDKIERYYPMASKIIKETGNFSNSNLQRQMKTRYNVEIGYNLAAKLIELIKEKGITTVDYITKSKIIKLEVKDHEPDITNPQLFLVDENTELIVIAIIDEQDNKIKQLRWDLNGTTQTPSGKGIRFTMNRDMKIDCTGFGTNDEGELTVLKNQTEEGLVPVTQTIILKKKERETISKQYILKGNWKETLIDTTKDQKDLNRIIFLALTENKEISELLEELKEMGVDIEKIEFE
ncbi:hypothetical protein J4459_04280 [Candidatus Woesearchaeota archaeon]|nr:hypothetical protein [Candidatus Woesearchaeota archaeon]